MSLAAIKRKLQVGQKVQMVRHDWGPGGLPMEKIAGVRTVARVQTNAVQFEGGSWLYFDRGAKEFRLTSTGFGVDLNQTGEFKQIMRYEWR